MQATVYHEAPNSFGAHLKQLMCQVFSIARITVPVEMVFSQPAHTSDFCAEGHREVEGRVGEVATAFTDCLRQNSLRRSMVSSPFLRIAT